MEGPERSRRDAPEQQTGGVSSLQQAAEWEKERALGRTGFILRRGVMTYGLPAAVLVILYKIGQEQGFSRTPALTSDLREAIVVAIVVFPLCGWLFGRWLWDTGEARYKALNRDSE